MSKKIAVISENELVTIEECHTKLGRGFSARTILRRIESGEYKEGIHWVNVASRDSKKRIIKINMAAIRQHIATPSRER